MKDSIPAAKIRARDLKLGRALLVRNFQEAEEAFLRAGEEFLLFEGGGIKGVISRLVWEKAKLFGLKLPLERLVLEVPSLSSEEILSAPQLFRLLKNPANRILIEDSLFSLKEWHLLGLKEEEPPLALSFSPAFRDLRQKALSAAAYTGLARVFLVGGGVRDMVLGLPVADFDLMVPEKVAPFAQSLARFLGGELVKSSLFGTYKIAWQGLEIDVTQSRWEYYEAPARLPRVFPGPLVWDLFRRDFTINALALDLKTLKILDPFGGIADLGARRLEILHLLSLVDDPTRIFRAARYATRFALKPSVNFKRALSLALDLEVLSLLSPARLKNEVFRILKEKDPLAPFEWLRARKVLEKLPTSKDFSFSSLKRLLAGDLPAKREEILEALLLLLAGEALVRWGVPDQKAKRLLSGFKEIAKERDFLCSEKVPLSAKVFWLEKLPRASILAAWARWPELDQPLREALAAFEVRPELNGHALKALGVPSGPLLGKLLKRLRAAKIDGQVKGRKEEIALLEKEFSHVLAAGSTRLDRDDGSATGGGDGA